MIYSATPYYSAAHVNMTIILCHCKCTVHHMKHYKTDGLAFAHFTSQWDLGAHDPVVESQIFVTWSTFGMY